MPGYFRRIREICDRHGILLIADEVMCGMGRTGTLYAVEQEGIAPDLVAIAKGLGGGYQPIGAVLVQQRIIAALERGSGFFQHGHTYIGHPVACAAALAVQQVIERDRLLDAVKTHGRAARATAAQPRSATIRTSATSAAAGSSWRSSSSRIGDAKRPFDPALRLHARIKAEAMARGLMVYPMGGTIDGRSGDHVLIAPPFITTPAEIDDIVRRLASAVDAALAAVAQQKTPA